MSNPESKPAAPLEYPSSKENARGELSLFQRFIQSLDPHGRIRRLFESSNLSTRNSNFKDIGNTSIGDSTGDFSWEKVEEIEGGKVWE